MALSLESSEGFDYEMKILLVGDAGVGKTSILLRYVHDTYQDDTLADDFNANFEYKIKAVDYNGKKVKLVIWDTAGQERFRTITNYRGVHGVFVVYSVNDPTSFNNLKQWLLEVKRYAQNPDLQRILLGNKADLEKNVTTESAQGFATSNGIQFFETSAKTNMKITEAFMELVKAVIQSDSSHAAVPSAPAPAPAEKKEKGGDGCCVIL